jgi:hypothetical protein
MNDPVFVMNTIIRTTQVLGLTSAMLLAGANLSSSILVIPILSTCAPSISTPFFHEFYLRGAATLVPLGLFSSSCSTLVACLLPEQRTIWVVAALAAFAQTPWTLLVMMGTNRKLIAIAESAAEMEKTSQEEVAALLSWWAWMNVVRGLFALTGGLSALWGVMQR